MTRVWAVAVSRSIADWASRVRGHGQPFNWSWHMFVVAVFSC